MTQLNRQDRFDSQVPTCLILTSSESASSIDSQFDSLCDDLKQRLKSKNIILDDKKCGNSKSAIEHIISKLESVFGVVRVAQEEQVPKDDDEGSGGDCIKINVGELTDDERIRNSDKEDAEMNDAH